MSVVKELKKLNRRSVNDDKRHDDTLRRAVRLNEKLLANQGGFKVVYFERDVRDSLHKFRKWRIWFEAHPLDSECVVRMVSAVHLEGLNVNFA